MSLAPKTIRPLLEQRAQLTTQIRAFFAKRHVLEVTTPSLSQASIPDPNIRSLTTRYNDKQTLYLQTSPEFHMKRLLSHGAGAIFQICPAFRDGESGSKHNPEFTLLEWYRPGFDLKAFMHEVSDLLCEVLNCGAGEVVSYQHIFKQHLAIDPLAITADELTEFGQSFSPFSSLELTDKDDWLNLLFSTLIEPKLGQHQPIFVHDYPASQAALAKLNPTDNRTALRFEVFYQGIELGNGFDELNNQTEQRQRFEAYNQIRAQKSLPIIPLDENFLQILDNLPQCSGVAIGFDRLLMLKLNKENITQVLPFPIEYA